MIFPLYGQPQVPLLTNYPAVRGEGHSPKLLEAAVTRFPRCCPGLADDPSGAHGAGAKFLWIDLTGPLAGCQPHLLDPLYTGPGSFLVSSALKLGEIGASPASPLSGLVALWFAVVK